MPTMLKCSDATLDGLHSLVPGLSDKPADDKMAHIHDHIKQMSGADDGDGDDDSKEMSTMSRPMLMKKARQMQAKLLKMSSITDSIPAMDEDTDALVRDSIEEKKTKCIDKGALTKAVADALEMSLIGSTEKPAWLGMARVEGSKGRKVPAAAAIFDLLADNVPVQTGRKTGGQHMSRVVPDADSAVETDPSKAVAHFNKTMSIAGARTL